MSVANIDGQMVALTRSGYRAIDGSYEHLRMFSPWVAARNEAFKWVLAPGQRICGEWLAMAHGTRYGDGPAFVAFDLMVGADRLPHDTFKEVGTSIEISTATVPSDGPPCSVTRALGLLGEFGHHGALEAPEGCVWKVERNGSFDFNCKYVRPEKVDGKYLPNIASSDPIWMRGIKESS